MNGKLKDDAPKPWWASMTIWGAVATFLGIALPAAGVGISATEVSQIADAWVNMLNAVLTFGGLVLTVVGRFRATKQIAPSVTGS